MANVFAQTEAALAFGKTRAGPRGGHAGSGSFRTASSRATAQSNTLLAFDRLTPAVLGKLVIAAVQPQRVHPGVVAWSINSFDQWGRRAGQGARQADRRRDHVRRRAGADLTARRTR